VAAAELRRRLQGARLYDWALITTDSPRRHLLVRRSLQPGEKGQLEVAFFRCWSPCPAAEGRRLFNLHLHVTRPRTFHQQWSGWRRRRQAAAANPTTPADS
jgi:hypothetical protein